MKVFTEPIGRHSVAMRRVARAMEVYAPESVEIVDNVKDADVVVSHVVDEIPPLLGKPEIVIQYCMSTAHGSPDFWRRRWSNAMTVWSYYDIPQIVGYNGFPFYYAPLGVDDEFKQLAYEQRPRDFGIMTSGYVTGSEAEAIEEVSAAAWMLGLKQVHLGPPNVQGMRLEIDLNSILGASDKQLAYYYRRCRWVSGLRQIEGFELPVVEGLCCGARPIVFDRPEMRHWYNGHAVFVPESSGNELVKYLLDVLAEEPEPVTRDEQMWAQERFNWEPIITGLWGQVL